MTRILHLTRNCSVRCLKIFWLASTLKHPWQPATRPAVSIHLAKSWILWSMSPCWHSSNPTSWGSCRKRKSLNLGCVRCFHTILKRLTSQRKKPSAWLRQLTKSKSWTLPAVPEPFPWACWTSWFIFLASSTRKTSVGRRSNSIRQLLRLKKSAKRKTSWQGRRESKKLKTPSIAEWTAIMVANFTWSATQSLGLISSPWQSTLPNCAFSSRWLLSRRKTEQKRKRILASCRCQTWKQSLLRLILFYIYTTSHLRLFQSQKLSSLKPPGRIWQISNASSRFTRTPATPTCATR